MRVDTEDMIIGFTIALVLFLTIVMFHGDVQADGGHHEPGPPGPPGIDGIDGINGIDGLNYDGSFDLGVSSSDFAEGLSLAFAFSGMDFTSTTTKLQLGVSGGWYDDKNSVAIGLAKVIDNETIGDVLFALKLGVANSHTAGSVSAVWNWQ